MTRESYFLRVHFYPTTSHYKVPLNAAPFALFSVTLAIFLGFYNNASQLRPFFRHRGQLRTTSRPMRGKRNP